MSRLIKCYGYCNKTYPKELLIKVGSQNHCVPCAERKEKDQKDREVLYKTIQKIFNIPYPSGHILRQIKQFKEDRNYTYEGMTKTLCYFVKVQNNNKAPFSNGGLSFLPYHYDKAIKYYNDLEEKRKNTADVNNNVRILKIPPIKHSNEEYRKRKIIDLGGILNDG